MIGRRLGRCCLSWRCLPFLLIEFCRNATASSSTSSILILTYVMLGWGLNIVVGLAGLLDLGYVAFYAVGAYSFALLAQHTRPRLLGCLPLAGILAAMWGLILGFPVLRLRGDYLAIVTLAFGEIVRVDPAQLVRASPTGRTAFRAFPSRRFFGLEFSRGDGRLRRLLRHPLSTRSTASSCSTTSSWPWR